jgi:general secretion pathway protein D
MKRRLLYLVVFGLLAVPGASAGDTFRRAHQIVLPRAEFEEASLSSVVSWLRMKSRELDPAAEGINVFVRQAPEADAPSRRARITLEVTNVPLADLIRYICDASGLRYRFDDAAVVIADPSFPMEKMETRFYRVKPTVFGVKSTKRSTFTFD